MMVNRYSIATRVLGIFAVLVFLQDLCPVWAGNLIIVDGSLQTNANPADPWEGDQVRRPDRQTCKEIDRALIIPVPPSGRGGAISRLDQTQATRLEQNSLAEFLGPKDAAMGTTASDVVRRAITRLEERKRLQLTEKVGGWALAEQEHLDQLKALSRSPTTSMLQPFLVRAIAKNEGSGEFEASLCSGRVLWITHYSVGSAPPPSVRLPVIVFLEQAPATVYVDWSMDQ
jgi:hypothetical protein